jgi:hypothetical protein
LEIFYLRDSGEVLVFIGEENYCFILNIKELMMLDSDFYFIKIDTENFVLDLI